MSSMHTGKWSSEVFCEAPCKFLSMKPFSAFKSPPRLSPYVLS